MNFSFLSDGKIYTVSELNLSIKNNLEEIYPFLIVRGEVSNFYHHNRRHMYFDLKDENAKIKVVMFYENNKDIDFQVEDGLNIKVTGYVSVYTQRGEYQIIASSLSKEGKGDLIEAFEKLKRKLAEKGYFDEKRKKKIPVLPKRIGLITSKGGAVIKDILSVLDRRFPNFHLILRNVNVQGITSSDQICEAIDDLKKYGVEVIIIARGGGSLEDLWAFNEEKLADKIFQCPVPIISAIGHETDFTICDFVSDIRAATPSVSAEIVMINKNDYIERLNIINKKLKDLLKIKNAYLKKEIGYLINRKIFKKPAQLLNAYMQAFDLVQISVHKNYRDSIKLKLHHFYNLQDKFDKRKVLSYISKDRIILSNWQYKVEKMINNFMNRKNNDLKFLMEKTDAASPIKIIQKGYAIVTGAEDERFIKSIEDVEDKKNIKVILRDGMLFAKVYDKIRKNYRRS